MIIHAFDIIVVLHQYPFRVGAVVKCKLTITHPVPPVSSYNTKNQKHIYVPTPNIQVLCKQISDKTIRQDHCFTIQIFIITPKHSD